MGSNGDAQKNVFTCILNMHKKRELQFMFGFMWQPEEKNSINSSRRKINKEKLIFCVYTLFYFWFYIFLYVCLHRIWKVKLFFFCFSQTSRSLNEKEMCFCLVGILFHSIILFFLFFLFFLLSYFVCGKPSCAWRVENS